MTRALRRPPHAPLAHDFTAHPTPLVAIGKNSAMTRTRLQIFTRVVCVAIGAVVVAACGSGSGPGWTYAPLGPTPSGGAAQTPAASPAGLLIEVATPPENPLVFVPSTLNAPPATLITVRYTNNSALEHNINFFSGSDATAPSLGATERATGPNAPRSVTFTTPFTAGAYFFHCEVHPTNMTGTLQVSGQPATPSASASPSAAPASPAATP